MPPRIKVTKEMVLDAAFEIIKTKGHEALNARTIADFLNCSTQPVLYNFKTVDEIRRAAYKIADEYHASYIMPKHTDENPFLSLGLNYVRFGHDEKNLFRFLFQTDNLGGRDIESLMADPELSDIITVAAEGLDCDRNTAREMFLTFFAIAHGLASLLANNTMEYNEEQCKKILKNAFFCTLSFRKGE